MRYKKYKFKTGQVVYPEGCSRDHQEKHPVTILWREKGEHGNLYSDDASKAGWYPETTLVAEIPENWNGGEVTVT